MKEPITEHLHDRVSDMLPAESAAGPELTEPMSAEPMPAESVHRNFAKTDCEPENHIPDAAQDMADMLPVPDVSLTTVLDLAVRRLDLALGALEGAAGRRMERARTQAGLGDALAVMQDDRSRLALDLDAALARSGRLERASEQVALRLDEAGAKLIDLYQDHPSLSLPAGSEEQGMPDTPEHNREFTELDHEKQKQSIEMQHQRPDKSLF